MASAAANLAGAHLNSRGQNFGERRVSALVNLHVRNERVQRRALVTEHEQRDGNDDLRDLGGLLEHEAQHADLAPLASPNVHLVRGPERRLFQGHLGVWWWWWWWWCVFVCVMGGGSR